MSCCGAKTLTARGCCVAPKKQKCKLVKEYEWICKPCKVSSCPGKCQSKCTVTFKRVKILKSFRRVPCGESACCTPCISELTCN